MGKAALVVIVLLFLATNSFSAYSDLSKDIKVDLIKTAPSVVADETEFTVYLVFTNNGTSKHTISFSVVSSSLFSHTGPGTITYYDIALQPGESINYDIEVYAKELVLAKNPLKIVIKEGVNSAVKTVFVTGTLEKKYIDITLENVSMQENNASLDLVLDPSEEFYNVQINLALSTLPMMVKGDDNVKIIPTLDKKTTIPMTLLLDENAESKIYHILVNTTANDAYNNAYSTVTYLPLKLEFRDDVSLGKVTSQPQTLKRDTKNNVINIEIANMGKDKIENVDSSFIIGAKGFDPSYFSSDSDFIGTIDAKERKTASFRFDIGKKVESGTYRGTLNITYYHLGQKKQKSFPVSVNVQKLPYFIVNQTSYEKDANNYVTFYVTNIGEECTNVEITGLTKNLPISWEQNSDKAAKLDENETKEFKLQFTFNELAAAKTYGIPIRIRCVYNQDPVTQEEEVYVVSKGQETNIIPLLVVGAFLIILVFLVGKYFFMKKEP